MSKTMPTRTRWPPSSGAAALSATTGELIVEGMKAAKAAGAITSFGLASVADSLTLGLNARGRISPLYQVLLDNRVQAMIIEPFDYPAVQAASLREQTTILEFDDPPVPHGLIMSRKALPAAQIRALLEREFGKTVRFEDIATFDLGDAPDRTTASGLPEMTGGERVRAELEVLGLEPVLDLNLRLVEDDALARTSTLHLHQVG